MKTVVGLTAVAALLLSGLAAPAHAAPSSATATVPTLATSLPMTAGASSLVPAFDSERQKILDQTNALRAQNGLAPLRLNAALNDIAQDWSVQQARASSMSHRPRFTALYPGGWTSAAENVAAGYQPGSVVNAWANSPGHRANLLSRSTDIGIGIAADSRGRLFYTQNFARYSSSPPATPGSVTRLSGSDRYATSASISVRAFPDGARTVYVASGSDFPDALSAAALAGAANGPLLLVSRTAVPSVIMAELRRLKPTRIVVAGGTGVVSDAVIRSLKSVTSRVTRIAGSDRYATSRALAQDAYGSSGAAVVYLATGSGFADALAAGPAAADAGAPVLLVNGAARRIDDATLALIRSLGATSVVVAGGTGAVSAGIESSLRSSGLSTRRFAGADRYATAALIAQAHFPDAAQGFVATGSGFADALSGGAAAGALGAPLFTSVDRCVPKAAHSALRSQDPDTLVLLGGHGALLPRVAGLYRC